MFNAIKKNRRRAEKTWRLTPIAQMLHETDSSPASVARLEKVSAAHVTKVCKGESQSARIQRRIGAILKKPWHEIQAEARARLESSRALAAQSLAQSANNLNRNNSRRGLNRQERRA